MKNIRDMFEDFREKAWLGIHSDSGEIQIEAFIEDFEKFEAAVISKTEIALKTRKIRPLTGRQLHLEYTETLGGILTGGFGFLSPQDKAAWNYCAERINQLKA